MAIWRTRRWPGTPAGAPLRHAPRSAHSTHAPRRIPPQARLREDARSRHRPPSTGARTGRFVVQRHRATRLHYDFRLEIDGVLVVVGRAQGPDARLRPSRRMAVHVEDHPIEYFDFEGVIPAKQYGAGDVIVWDWGTWEPEAPTLDPRRAIEDGELKFRLHGEKLKGRFTIVRTSGRRRKGDDPAARAFEDDEGEQWLLIKKRDEASSSRLGRRGPPAERQDRPDQRRGQGRSRRAVDRPGAGGRGRDRPDRGRRGADAAVHRADARRRSRSKAFSDPDWLFEIKWDGFRVAGRGRRRQGQDLDPQPQRRRDLLPAAADAAVVDRRQAGDRRRRGRRPRRGRPARLQPAPGAKLGQKGVGGPRLPGVRPALPRRPVAARRPARGPQAAAPERAQGRTRASASRRTSSARAWRSSRRPRANGLEGIIAKLRR